MAKKLKAVVKLNLTAGKANPAPPVGPALASHGINIMAFCKEYNARTQNRAGEILPAEITIFTDGSFTFILKTPPASYLLKKAAGIETASAEITMVPDTTVKLADKDAEKMQKLLDALDEDDDVQNVYGNYEFADENE